MPIRPSRYAFLRFSISSAQTFSTISRGRASRLPKMSSMSPTRSAAGSPRTCDRRLSTSIMNLHLSFDLPPLSIPSRIVFCPHSELGIMGVVSFQPSTFPFVSSVDRCDNPDPARSTSRVPPSSRGAKWRSLWIVSTPTDGTYTDNVYHSRTAMAYVGSRVTTKTKSTPQAQICSAPPWQGMIPLY